MAREDYTTKGRSSIFGFAFMLSTVVWAAISFALDLHETFLRAEGFSWFSASGAVMVVGSIVFERMLPGTNASGGLDISGLPTTFERPSPLVTWLHKYAGWFSMPTLLMGTAIWGYGALLV